MTEQSHDDKPQRQPLKPRPLTLSALPILALILIASAVLLPLRLALTRPVVALLLAAAGAASYWLLAAPR